MHTDRQTDLLHVRRATHEGHTDVICRVLDGQLQVLQVTWGQRLGDLLGGDGFAVSRSWWTLQTGDGLANLSFRMVPGCQFAAWDRSVL